MLDRTDHGAADSIPRFIHHLGPRYSSRFQTTQLARFFTYEASTALHIFLDSAAHQSVVKADILQLQHVVREGLSVGESSIVFSLNTASELQSTDTGIRLGFVGLGDIFLVKNGTLDMALWRIGGTAVALRLVQLANVRRSVLMAFPPRTLMIWYRAIINYHEPWASLLMASGIAGRTLRTSSDFVSAAHIHAYGYP